MASTGVKSRSRTRQSQTEATSKRLLSIALKSIAVRGVDQTTLQVLASDAKTSIGPIYSRYESADDLVSDVFEKILEAHFHALLDDLHAWCVDGDRNARDRLAKELAKPSTESKALVEVLAVARRYPLTGDVVRTSVSSAVRRLVTQAGTTRAPLTISRVTIFLGAIFIFPVLPEHEQATTDALLELLKEASDNDAATRERPRSPEPITLPLPTVQTDNELYTDFANALFHVIARTGYEKASANRISRASQRSFASIYRDFESKDVFMESVVTSFVDQMVLLNLTPFFGISREEYLERSVTMARTLVSDENRAYRQLRLETVVAARHHSKIARSLKRQFTESAKVLHQLVDEHFGKSAPKHLEEANALWLLVRSNGLGFSLLTANTSILESIQWAPGSAALYGLLEARGFTST